MTAAAPTVLMTADTIGGVWRYAIELCTWLGERGATVALATMGNHMTRAQRREARAISGLEVFESNYRLEWMNDPWADVDRAAAWLLDLESVVRPSVVHLNGYAHGALPWRAPALIVAHSCVESWFRAVKSESAPSSYDTYRRAVTQGLARVGAVVAPTAAMLRALEEAYGPVWTGRVIPNGLRAEHFCPSEKQPVVLSVGRMWDPAKNLRALSAAAERIEWPVVIAGSRTPPVEEATREMPCAVRALGQVSAAEVSRWMALAAIYALPAYYEPFGLSVLEAALSGCALVLGDVPSLRETWAGAALFVEPGDHAALAQTLKRLIDDRTLRAQLAVRARSRGRAFSADRMGAGYLAVYHELMDATTAQLPIGA